MQKSIQTEPAGWSAGSSAGANTYVLYAVSQAGAAAPGDGGFGNAATKFAASSALNSLTDASATQAALGPTSGTTNLFYKLDMPTMTSTQASRTITVRYTGTAQ